MHHSASDRILIDHHVNSLTSNSRFFSLGRFCDTAHVILRHVVYSLHAHSLCLAERSCSLHTLINVTAQSMEHSLVSVNLLSTHLHNLRVDCLCRLIILASGNLTLSKSITLSTQLAFQCLDILFNNLNLVAVVGCKQHRIRIRLRLLQQVFKSLGILAGLLCVLNALLQIADPCKGSIIPLLEILLGSNSYSIAVSIQHALANDIYTALNNNTTCIDSLRAGLHLLLHYLLELPCVLLGDNLRNLCSRPNHNITLATRSPLHQFQQAHDIIARHAVHRVVSQVHLHKVGKHPHSPLVITFLRVHQLIFVRKVFSIRIESRETHLHILFLLLCEFQETFCNSLLERHRLWVCLQSGRHALARDSIPLGKQAVMHLPLLLSLKRKTQVSQSSDRIPRCHIMQPTDSLGILTKFLYLFRSEFGIFPSLREHYTFPLLLVQRIITTFVRRSQFFCDSCAMRVAY